MPGQRLAAVGCTGPTPRSPLFVYGGTAATSAGGFADVTVDSNPASPNYGAVYAAINWFAGSADEPGYRLLASSDFGRTWAATEVPALPAASGYRFRYRIGYRLRTGPDGSVYASLNDRPAAPEPVLVARPRHRSHDRRRVHGGRHVQAQAAGRHAATDR